MLTIEALEAETAQLKAEAVATRARTDATTAEIATLRERAPDLLTPEAAADLVAAGVLEETTKRKDAAVRRDAELGAHGALFVGLGDNARSDSRDPMDEALRDQAEKRRVDSREGPPKFARVRQA